MNAIRRLVTVAVVVALLVPVLRNRDSFPLSTYPMYARQRGSEISFTTAIGVDPGGERQRLSLELIGGSDDPLIVGSLTRQAARGGPVAVDDLCADIADRVARSGGSSVAGEIVTERHDVVARARGDDTSLVSSDRLASCPVDRR